MQNSYFWSRITSLYGSQTSPVVLCIQNSVINTVSIGFSPHLWFWTFKTATLEPKLHISIGARPHLWFCAYKIECLASELSVSMGPSPHLWFLDAKKNEFWIRITSLHGSQTWPVVLCMQNSVISTGNTSLHGSQPSSVVFGCKKKKDRIISLHESQTWPVFLCKQNSMINTGITSLHGSHSSSLVFACKTATFGSELLVSMGPRTHLSFCECITAWFASQVLVSMCSSPHLCFLHVNRLLIHNYKSLCVPDLTCRFVHEKQRD